MKIDVYDFFLYDELYSTIRIYFHITKQLSKYSCYFERYLIEQKRSNIHVFTTKTVTHRKAN